MKLFRNLMKFIYVSDMTGGAQSLSKCFTVI